MANPNFDRDRAARIVAEAIAGGDVATCQKHGISKRTLHRYRKRLESDPELAKVVADKKALVEKDWAEKLPSAISKSIEFLERAAGQTNADDPDMVHSVAGALKILTDVALSRRLVDARLSRTNGDAGKAPPAGNAGRAGGDPGRKVVPLR